MDLGAGQMYLEAWEMGLPASTVEAGRHRG